MKQSLLRFTSILIGCLMIVSCHERTRLRRITSQFIESRIIFPDNLYAVKKRIYGKADIAKLQEHKLIIYIDSLSCGPCRISHFHDMIPLYEFAESNGRFSVMTIFSPTADSLHEIEKELVFLDFPYPIYIDVYGEFSRLNTIPNDTRFHEFLINKNGEITFIGNPMDSESLKSIFLNSL